MQVKPGYWDQNVRTPGYLLPRTGGSNYTNAWNNVNNDPTVNRVYIESFNEYDEGSGIYAAKIDTIYKSTTGGFNNTGNDVWSATNNPYEYLTTTATGAAQFNDDSALDAKIIWHNIPSQMQPNETFNATIVVRNEGNERWNAANNFKFGENENLDATLFGPNRYTIDDTQDEIPIYDGIFRGRVKTFNLTVIAPNTPGVYQTNWGMLQEGNTWFGDTLMLPITVTLATGINSNNIDNNISIYPNPASSMLNIDSENIFTTIEVYNVSGQLILEKTTANTNKYLLDIKQLEKGFYILKVYSKNAVKSFKFTKK